MKKKLIIATFLISNHLFAAIGCLPGDCCPGGVPCGGTSPSPSPRPPHSCFNLESNKVNQSRFVSACNECDANEVCGEFSNNENQIIAHQCIKPN